MRSSSTMEVVCAAHVCDVVRQQQLNNRCLSAVLATSTLRRLTRVRLASCTLVCCGLYHTLRCYGSSGTPTPPSYAPKNKELSRRQTLSSRQQHEHPTTPSSVKPSGGDQPPSMDHSAAPTAIGEETGLAVDDVVWSSLYAEAAAAGLLKSPQKSSSSSGSPTPTRSRSQRSAEIPERGRRSSNNNNNRRKAQEEEVSASFRFPLTLRAQPYKYDKFLSLQSRTLEQYLKAHRELLERHAKLRRARQAQLGHSHQSEGERLTSPHPAPPLPVSLAQELEILERKLLQLEGEQGFTVTEELVYAHFQLLIDLNAYAAALQWLEERVMMAQRGPPYPTLVRKGLLQILQEGILPLLPEASSSLRVPLSVAAAAQPEQFSSRRKGTRMATALTTVLHRCAASTIPVEHVPHKCGGGTRSSVVVPQDLYVEELEDLSRYFQQHSGSVEESSFRRFHPAFSLKAFLAAGSRSRCTAAGASSSSSLESVSASPGASSPGTSSGLLEDLENPGTLRPPNPYRFSMAQPFLSSSPPREAAVGATAVSPPSTAPASGVTPLDGEEVSVDTLLRVRAVGQRFFQWGECGAGAVALAASAPAPREDTLPREPLPSLKPPLHASYTHHLLTSLLLPVLHIMELMGLWFDDVSPARNPHAKKCAEKEGKEEEDQVPISTWSKDWASVSAYVPPDPSPAQRYAVQRALYLFDPTPLKAIKDSSTPTSVEEEVPAVAPVLLDLKETLDLYACVIRCVTEAKEPTLLVLLQTSLLAGFYQLPSVSQSEGSGATPASDVAPRVAEALWLQRLVVGDSNARDTGTTDGVTQEERDAGQFLLHSFLQESWRHLYAARQAIHLEKVLVWRTLDVLQRWKALQHLIAQVSPSVVSPPTANDTQETPIEGTTIQPVVGRPDDWMHAAPPQLLYLCRGFQCFHYEWARTEAGNAQRVEEGEVRRYSSLLEPQHPQWLEGVVTLGCHYLPLHARPSPLYPFLRTAPAPPLGEPQGETEGEEELILEHLAWHRLWSGADIVTRVALKAMLPPPSEPHTNSRRDHDVEEHITAAIAQQTELQDLWAQTAGIVGLTPLSAVPLPSSSCSLCPTDVENKEEEVGRAKQPAEHLLQAVFRYGNLKKKHRNEEGVALPEWMTHPTVQLVLERNLGLHQLLQRTLLRGGDEAGLAASSSYTREAWQDIRQCFLASPTNHSNCATLATEGGSIFSLLWEAMVERLLLSVSLDLHLHILTQVPPFPSVSAQHAHPTTTTTDPEAVDLPEGEHTGASAEEEAETIEEEPADVSGATTSTKEEGDHGVLPAETVEEEVLELYDDDEAANGSGSRRPPSRLMVGNPRPVAASESRLAEDVASDEEEPHPSLDHREMADKNEEEEHTNPSGETPQEPHDGGEEHSMSSPTTPATPTLNYVSCLVVSGRSPDTRNDSVLLPPATSSASSLTVPDVCDALLCAIGSLLHAWRTQAQSSVQTPAEGKETAWESGGLLSVSPAALASLGLLIEACHGLSPASPSSLPLPNTPLASSGTLGGGEAVTPPARVVLQQLLRQFFLTGPSGNGGGAPSACNGNAIALLALAAARVGGLWPEVTQLLEQYVFQDAKGPAVEERASGSAVQLDPAVLSAIFVAARNAGVPAVCLLLRSHREDVFFV